VDKPLKSVTHGQCDARPTVTFPAAGHHRPLTGTKLYCLVTEAHACEQLAQGCYLKVERPAVEPATCCVKSQHTNHYTSRPHSFAHKSAFFVKYTLSSGAFSADRRTSGFAPRLICGHGLPVIVSLSHVCQGTFALHCTQTAVLRAVTGCVWMLL